MNNHLYSRMCLLICYNKNVRKTPEEERNFKKRTYMFT